MPTTVQINDGKSVPLPRNTNAPKRRRKPKAKQQRKRKSKQSNAQTIARTGKGVHIMDKGSMCVRDFVRAFRDPFTISGICLPAAPSWPSRKLCTRQYLTMNAGTNGYGYIIVQPDASNNTACVWYTDATWAGAGGNAVTTTPGSGVNAAVNAQSPYTASQFGNGAGLLNQRCVIASVRIRYIGTTLTASGIVIPIVVPQYQTLNGTSPNAIRASVPDAESQPVSRGYHTIRWAPTSPDLYNYYTQSYTNMDAPMIILVNGFQASAPFDVEIVYHHEVVGTGLDATPSYASPTFASVASRLTNLGLRAQRTGILSELGGAATRVAAAYARGRLRGGAGMLRDDL